jgi:hypothetical protein
MSPSDRRCQTGVWTTSLTVTSEAGRLAQSDIDAHWDLYIAASSIATAPLMWNIPHSR